MVAPKRMKKFMAKFFHNPRREKLVYEVETKPPSHVSGFTDDVVQREPERLAECRLGINEEGTRNDEASTQGLVKEKNLVSHHMPHLPCALHPIQALNVLCNVTNTKSSKQAPVKRSAKNPKTEPNRELRAVKSGHNKPSPRRNLSFKRSAESSNGSRTPTSLPLITTPQNDTSGSRLRRPKPNLEANIPRPLSMTRAPRPQNQLSSAQTRRFISLRYSKRAWEPRDGQVPSHPDLSTSNSEEESPDGTLVSTMDSVLNKGLQPSSASTGCLGGLPFIKNTHKRKPVSDVFAIASNRNSQHGSSPGTLCDGRSPHTSLVLNGVKNGPSRQSGGHPPIPQIAQVVRKASEHPLIEKHEDAVPPPQLERPDADVGALQTHQTGEHSAVDAWLEARDRMEAINDESTLLQHPAVEDTRAEQQKPVADSMPAAAPRCDAGTGSRGRDNIEVPKFSCGPLQGPSEESTDFLPEILAGSTSLIPKDVSLDFSRISHPAAHPFTIRRTASASNSQPVALCTLMSQFSEELGQGLEDSSSEYQGAGQIAETATERPLLPRKASSRRKSIAPSFPDGSSPSATPGIFQDPYPKTVAPSSAAGLLGQDTDRSDSAPRGDDEQIHAPYEEAMLSNPPKLKGKQKADCECPLAPPTEDALETAVLQALGKPSESPATSTKGEDDVASWRWKGKQGVYRDARPSDEELEEALRQALNHASFSKASSSVGRQPSKARHSSLPLTPLARPSPEQLQEALQHALTFSPSSPSPTPSTVELNELLSRSAPVSRVNSRGSSISVAKDPITGSRFKELFDAPGLQRLPSYSSGASARRENPKLKHRHSARVLGNGKPAAPGEEMGGVAGPTDCQTGSGRNFTGSYHPQARRSAPPDRDLASQAAALLEASLYSTPPPESIYSAQHFRSHGPNGFLKGIRGANRQSMSSAAREYLNSVNEETIGAHCANEARTGLPRWGHDEV